MVSRERAGMGFGADGKIGDGIEMAGQHGGDFGAFLQPGGLETVDGLGRAIEQ
jgi:hypothetical protein